MRVLVTALTTVIVGALFILDSPVYSEAVGSFLAKHYHGLLYQKELRIRGTELIDDRALRALLPLNSSVPEWLFSRTFVEADVLQHPFVKRVSVKPCDGGAVRSWGCFEIDVEERRPRYLAASSGDLWVLGDDGGFITKVPSGGDAVSKREREDPLVARLFAYWRTNPPISVRGLVVDHQSPELVQVRFLGMKRALDVVQDELGMQPESVVIKDSGDLGIKFRSLPLVATFDIGPGNFEWIRIEAARLKRLLEEFGERRDRIAEVDLVYDKLAVVRLAQQG